MDSGVIISLILGAASIVSSICFGLIPNIRKNRIEKLEMQRDRLFRDIQLFYDVEDKLLEYVVNNIPNTNKGSLKIKNRDIVSNMHNGDKLSVYSQPSVFKRNIK